jgi:zinc and cadmium transporter
VVSLLALIGIAFISLGEAKLKRLIFFMVSLAVGSLFGDAFIHLLPRTFDQFKNQLAASLWVLGGIFLFFILEKFLLWRHQHTMETGGAVRRLGYMNLLADGVHNMIDGMIIGVSYQVSLSVGIATTTAVIFHEIPHELGNFFILLYAGFSKSKALFFNFISGCFAILGTVAALMIGARVESFSLLMLPLAAGGFIYIAGSDLVPELNRESDLGKSIVQLIGIIIGVGLMLLLTLLE